jgi:hypothetical protein
MPKKLPLQITDPWVRKSPHKTKGYNIGAMLGNRTVEGDIGIEIEVEGNKFPKHEYEGRIAVSPELIPPEWKYHRDGSLRGDDNAEYVFAKPLKFEAVPDAIKSLWNMFDKFGSKLDESNRTSVHVHLNAQKWHLNRLCAFAAIYFSLEELLTEWCGDHRVGNMFCLRAKDAPAIITKLKSFLNDQSTGSLSDGLHYAGLNVQALMKFGSVEIRALRGCTDYLTILNWVDMLQRIYDISGEYHDPRQVIEGFSGEGPMGYLDRILGPHAAVLRNGISWDNQRVMESLYEGIRLAQDLCYCREWQDYEPVNMDKDPFNRDIKEVAEMVATYEHLYGGGLAQSASMFNSITPITATSTPSNPWPTLSATAPTHDPIYIPPSDSEYSEDEDDSWLDADIFDAEEL